MTQGLKKPKQKRNAKPKLTDKAQSERFMEAARNYGVDESGQKFERALRVVLASPRNPIKKDTA